MVSRLQKILIGSLNTLLSEEELTPKVIYIPHLEREGSVVVPEQHYAVGGKNSSEMSPFCDSFICCKAILQAYEICIYCYKNMIKTSMHLHRARACFLRYFIIFPLYFTCILCYLHLSHL